MLLWVHTFQCSRGICKNVIFFQGRMERRRLLCRSMLLACWKKLPARLLAGSRKRKLEWKYTLEKTATILKLNFILRKKDIVNKNTCSPWLSSILVIIVRFRPFAAIRSLATNKVAPMNLSALPPGGARPAQVPVDAELHAVVGVVEGFRLRTEVNNFE